MYPANSGILNKARRISSSRSRLDPHPHRFTGVIGTGAVF
jgi:hypothetical protein